MPRFEFDERLDAANLPEDWHDNVIVLWTEDDATRSDPSAEHIAGAWQRFTGQPYKERSRYGRGPHAEWSGGDSGETVYSGGWVIGVAPDGNYLGRVVKAEPPKPLLPSSRTRPGGCHE